MGSADEVNIQASELNRTMKVVAASPVNVLHDGKARQCRSRHALQCVHTDKCWLPVACMCRWVLFAVSIRIRPFVFVHSCLAPILGMLLLCRLSTGS